MEEDYGIDLSRIPRRKRRFFRNNKILLKALSKHVKKAADAREIEKQKIIESLRYRLERAEGSELLDIADSLFEQLSGKETANIVFSNIRAKKAHTKELTDKDCEEIAENIYLQLKEIKEAEKRKLREEMKKQREVEKIKKRLAKIQGLHLPERKKTGRKRGPKHIKPKEQEVQKPAMPELKADIEAEEKLKLGEEGDIFKELGIEGESSLGKIESEESSLFKELEELSREEAELESEVPESVEKKKRKK